MSGLILNKMGCLTMAANAVSQNIALPVGGGLVLSVFNRGPQDAFIEISNDANQVAIAPSGTTAGSAVVAANQPAAVFQLKTSDTRIAAVSAGNSTMYFTVGRDM